jgi:fatty-acyl-CoA synthase
MNHAGDDIVLINEEFVPLMGTILSRVETVKDWVVISESGDSPESAIRFSGEYEALLGAQSEEYAFEDFDEELRATIFYTTGTTGNPKGVYYSHRQIVLHTLGKGLAMGSPAEQGRFHDQDVYMPLTPMFHAHAWGVPYLATLLGVKQIYPGRYEPKKLLNLFQKESVTFSHCVPTILHMVLNAPEAESVDFSGWKMTIGGSALPVALAVQARARGIDLFSGYGMSETGPVLTLAQLSGEYMASGEDEQIDVRCRSGRPAPLVDIRVVDAEMNDLPHDGVTIGEVVARAPWLTQGYFKDPEQSEELWRGGYLHTGDLGYLDDSGYLKVTDRVKDVIKSGGEWISSIYMEDIALQHDNVSEAAAIGIADEKWGERPLVLVVPRQGELDPETVRNEFLQAVSDGLISKWAVPDRIEVVDAIPKTSVGKIDKKHLRTQFR